MLLNLRMQSQVVGWEVGLRWTLFMNRVSDKLSTSSLLLAGSSTAPTMFLSGDVMLLFVMPAQSFAGGSALKTVQHSCILLQKLNDVN